MKRYAFQLETLRKVKRIREEETRSALLHANLEVQRAVAAVQARIDEYEQSMVPATSHTMASFKKGRYFNELAARAVVAAQQVQADAEVHAGEKRQVWSGAARDLKTLDRLDERKKLEHDQEMKRLEVKELDEIVVSRFGRQVGG